MSNITSSSEEILRHESGPVVRVAFEGQYPPGSAGNACAAEMASHLQSVLAATSASAILFDLRNLSYSHGDAICSLALALSKDGVFIPSAIVAAGPTAVALQPLLTPRWVFGIAGTKLFHHMPEAIAHLESRLEERASARTSETMPRRQAFVIADTKPAEPDAAPVAKSTPRRPASLLGEMLKQMAVDRYSRARLTIGDPPDPVVSFEATHPSIGTLDIMDDGDEATMFIGAITHSHFSCYDDDISDQERARRIVQDVISFLDDLFADRVLIWISKDKTHGGWETLTEETTLDPNARNYVWSGPIAEPETQS